MESEKPVPGEPENIVFLPSHLVPLPGGTGVAKVSCVWVKEDRRSRLGEHGQINGCNHENEVFPSSSARSHLHAVSVVVSTVLGP